MSMFFTTLTCADAHSEASGCNWRTSGMLIIGIILLINFVASKYFSHALSTVLLVSTLTSKFISPLATMLMTLFIPLFSFFNLPVALYRKPKFKKAQQSSQTMLVR
eukprot:NODE_528_length_7173_cov_0.249929.p5 type:complete len:106 gc:universal NODE_528_length_7173_cov_0.249929:1994-2311(+)